MPEYDPIRDLERFTMGDLATGPLPPTEVRRLGDRRRTRRRNLAVAGAGLAVAIAVALPFALTAAGGDSKGDRSHIAGTPTPTSSPSSTAGLITYPEPGVRVTTAADTAQLTGTTEAFKDFIAAEASRVQRANPGCSDAAQGVTVKKYDTAGYAIGGVNDCGGYVALWVSLDGAWQEGMGTQDAWDCDTLSYLAVPRSFAGDCTDEAGNFGPTEVSGLRLGMTRAQVESAGGTVEAGPDTGCRGLLLPYYSPVPDHTDGWFSLAKGLVAVAARPGMKTPERIGLGSSRAAVEAAYPSGRLSVNGYWVVPLAGGTEYQIGIEADGTVRELLLSRTDQDCFG